MEIRPFPNCCGACVIVGFGEPGGKAGRQKYVYHPDDPGYSFIQYETLGTTNDQEFTKLMGEMDKREESYGRYKAGKALFAILNDRQCLDYKGHWPKRLKEAGFIPVSKWYNSSGSICNLFMRVSPKAARELEIINWE